MTHDIDEHYIFNKVLDIRRLWNDDDGHLKRFFDKGLSALLADKYFLLLYVPKDGAKMRIIRPATDPYHRKRIITRINNAKSIPSFYYALSHLWGISKDNPQLWEEIGDYVDDIDGQPAAPVSMRPEKCATLLALLRAHPNSYWWIDVLCARTDTPLDIMGDIYSCCLECIAMIDCEPSLLSNFRTKKNMREELYVLGNLSIGKDFLRGKRLYTKYPHLHAQVNQLKQSEWWKRVWTWQEMALPYGTVRFIAETDDEHFQTNTTTLDALINCFKNLCDILLYLKMDDIEGRKDKNRKPGNFRSRFMFEICQARAFNKHRIGKKSASGFFSLIMSLSVSRRRCMDPVDYVYGVLGMFQIKIPRMSDPAAVWQRFLSELQQYMEPMKNDRIVMDGAMYKIGTLDDRTCPNDLQKAKNMSYVYRKLYHLITENIESDSDSDSYSYSDSDSDNYSYSYSDSE